MQILGLNIIGLTHLKYETDSIGLESVKNLNFNSDACHAWFWSI